MRIDRGQECVVEVGRIVGIKTEWIPETVKMMDQKGQLRDLRSRALDQVTEILALNVRIDVSFVKELRTNIQIGTCQQKSSNTANK